MRPSRPVGRLRAILGMQDRPQPRAVRDIREIQGMEIDRDPEIASDACDEDSLAMLWDEAARVDDSHADLVSQFILQGGADHPESAPAVVAQEVLDVFEQDDRRLVVLDDPCHVEEESALRIAVEAV